MATLEIYKEQRVVLVRFRRSKHGNPSFLRPDIDDRGTRNEYGPIVGLSQGKEITVRLERLMIDKSAELHVKSSDTSVAKISDPATGTLPSTDKTDIKIKGVAGGNAAPKTAKIQVRYKSATGPIIHELIVWCFRRRTLNVTPHIVTISGKGPPVVPGTASTANVAQIMTHVRAIWRPVGVRINVGTTQNDAVTFGTANIVSDNPFPGEIKKLLQTNWVANTINVYFVRQIAATGGTLGYGFSRSSSVTFGTGNPGIILADQAANGSVHDTIWAGNDLAHEIGHFLKLWHADNKQPPNEREDTWCRRMLMHNFNLQPKQNNWKDDVGYGQSGGFSRRGALITNKNLAKITGDRESRTARSALVAGPY